VVSKQEVELKAMRGWRGREEENKRRNQRIKG
jgi:hypothetical protein